MDKMQRFFSALLPFIVLLGFLTTTPTQVQGQTDKEEAKKWKKLAKKYKKDPQLLKVEIETYESSISALKTQIKDQDRRFKRAMEQQSDEDVAQLKMDNVELQQQVKRLNNENGRLKQELATMNQLSRMGVPDGLIYRVQIAAYVHANDMAESLGGGFKIEDGDGMKKYLVGAFRTYEEAAQLRGEFQKIGIKDAWIAAYIDGQRVTMREAGEYASAQDAGGSPFFLEGN